MSYRYIICELYVCVTIYYIPIYYVCACVLLGRLIVRRWMFNETGDPISILWVPINNNFDFHNIV